MKQSLQSEPEFKPQLRFFDSLTIVVGSMIGSGIFIVSANIAHDVGSPIMLLLVWIVTGVITITAALSYGELGAMMPHAGGQYIYLRESFGRGAGFLYGWTLFLVIQTGTIAAVAVAFAKFLHLFIPSVSLDPLWYPLRSFGIEMFAVSTGQLVAIGIIFLLTFINIFGIKTGSIIQNVFTVAKVAGLIILILVAFLSGKGNWNNFTPVLPSTLDFNWLTYIMIFGGAMVGSLFASDAWNNLTFASSEIKNPKRNLPLALATGTMIVTGIYIIANVAYIYIFPVTSIANVAELAKSAQTVTIGGEIIRVVAGETWIKLFALAVLISVFGCLNGLILAGARVYYAMARDGLFFEKMGHLHQKYITPAVALIAQAIWTSVLALSGTYSNLLDYVIFAVLIFYVLTVFGIFILRKKHPDWERPYKAIGYPYLPALYIALALLINIDLLFVKPAYTWPGLIIVALGIPVYFYWNHKSKHT